MPKLYIVDGSSYFFRAYFAVMPLSTSRGLPTNAIFGFSNMLLKLVSDFKPEYLAITFDTAKPTFRKEMYEGYKANRDEMPDDLSEQVPYIKKVVDAFEIPSLEKEGFEADDIIGTLVDRYQKKNWEVVIVSSDKDLMQLIGKNVTMYDSMKLKSFGVSEVQEKFGVLPEQIIDLLALAGDSSDNVPGVPNIGIKTAAKLLTEFGTLDVLYQNLDKLKGKQKESLEMYKENAYLSRDLVTLDLKVDVPCSEDDLKFNGYNQDKLAELFQELEFNKLIKELGLISSTKKSSLSCDSYSYIKNMSEFNVLVKKLEVEKEVSFDFETTSLNTREAELVGMSFSFLDGTNTYLPLAHKTVPSGVTQVSTEEVLKKLKPFFESEKIEKIGQNLKYEYRVLKRYGISLRGVANDTMVASYLINPEMAHNLDALTLQYLNHQNMTYGETVGLIQDGKKVRKKKGEVDKTFADAPFEKAYVYACEDSDVTLRLHQIFKKELKELNLTSLYEDVEMPLVSVLGDMEANGIKVDLKFLKDLSQKMEIELATNQKKIYELAGEEFNIRSTKQLATILFEKLKLPVVKKTKTGFSTNEAVLKVLSEKHELPKHILEFRELAKLKSTYVDAFFEIADPKTHRIHSSFNQTVVATGRISSTKPNLQNIPIRSERGKQIRKAFIAEKDHVLVSVDYSQIELRILAHLSEDPALVKAFKSGGDIHTATAEEIFQKEKISKEDRSIAKAINFGIIYGQSAYGLARTIDIPIEDAASYIKTYFEKYHGVHEFIKKTLYQARKKGYTETVLGRRRYHPNLRSPNEMLKNAAERVAVNAPMQGSASDLIKKAMIMIWRKMTAEKMKSKLLLQVHDELIFEVHKTEEKELCPYIVETMENALTLSVPLKVDMVKGQSWAK